MATAIAVPVMSGLKITCHINWHGHFPSLKKPLKRFTGLGTVIEQGTSVGELKKSLYESYFGEKKNLGTFPAKSRENVTRRSRRRSSEASRKRLYLSRICVSLSTEKT